VLLHHLLLLKLPLRIQLRLRAQSLLMRRLLLSCLPRHFLLTGTKLILQLPLLLLLGPARRLLHCLLPLLELLQGLSLLLLQLLHLPLRLRGLKCPCGCRSFVGFLFLVSGALFVQTLLLFLLLLFHVLLSSRFLLPWVQCDRLSVVMEQGMSAAELMDFYRS
jgi:hypothetical protein